jgi:hypothetical protein
MSIKQRFCSTYKLKPKVQFELSVNFMLHPDSDSKNVAIKILLTRMLKKEIRYEVRIYVRHL